MEEGGLPDGAMKTGDSMLKRLLASAYLALAFRLFLGVVFLFAGMTKIPYPAEFAEALAAYRIVPYWMVNVSAIFLPWLEVVCGLFLLIGLATRAAAAIIGCLLGLFTAAIVITLFRGVQIGCGCFDTAGEEISWWFVLRDIVWLLMSVHVFYFDRMMLLRRVGFRFSMKRTRV